MKRITVAALLTCVGCAAAMGVFAHQPRIISTPDPVAVAQPEISKAYYGQLAGQPATYIIESSKPFELYVGLLSPQIEGAKVDFSAAIADDNGQIANLNGQDYDWLVMYEPFGGDYYNQGPEHSVSVEAGNYTITVSNPGNIGRYALAIGKVESFPPGEFIKTLATLPALKRDFFDKSPWIAYNNFIGLFTFVGIVAAGLAVYIIASFIHWRRLKKRLDCEYAKGITKRYGYEKIGKQR